MSNNIFSNVSTIQPNRIKHFSITVLVLFAVKFIYYYDLNILALLFASLLLSQLDVRVSFCRHVPGNVLRPLRFSCFSMANRGAAHDSPVKNGFSPISFWDP